jgi:integrase
MFTDRSLKALKPRTQAYRQWENGYVPGFCVRVTPKGVKTFYLQYTFAGRQRFMSLGRYPAISLAEARERARAAREEVERGNDPRASTLSDSGTRQRTGTVRDAAELYVEDMKARGKTSWDKVEYSMESDVYPEIGDLLARDIAPSHVQSVLARVIARGVTRQHNKVRSHLHSVMQFALHYDYDPRARLQRVRFGMRYNPVASVPRDKAAQARTIERNLSFDEIKAVWSFNQWHLLPHTALKLLLALGGLRPIEVLGMRRAELDLAAKTFTVPPERFKGRRYHVVPVCSIAEDLLAQPVVPELESDLIFPTLRGDDQIEHYAVASLGQYLDRQFRRGNWPEEVARFTPYDLRRTFKTRTGEMGIDKTIRDRIQGHAMTDVSSKHYDRWDYLPEKRQAMERWDKRLREVISTS